jgi:hypothetical protein
VTTPGFFGRSYEGPFPIHLLAPTPFWGTIRSTVHSLPPSLLTPHSSRLTAPDQWPPITRFSRSGRGEECFLRRQKPPRTRTIAWQIPWVARITAHAGSEHLLRPSPRGSDTLTHSIVRCALPEGIPIFFGVEKSIPHPGPLPPRVFTVYH